MAVYGEQVTSELTRGKKLGAWSLGIWRPLDLFPAPYSSPEKYFTQPASHPASKITWCSILLKVRDTSYCKWYSNHIHIIQPSELLFGPHSSFQEYQNSFFIYRAPRGFSWVSLVMSITCDMRVIPRQAYGVVSVYISIKVETPFVINLSSAHIFCDLNNSHNWTRRSVPSPCT